MRGAQMAPYVSAVEAELENFARRHGAPKVGTIFFGGGTPTALPTPLLLRLFAAIHKHCDLTALSEWTVEMNPATVSQEKAAAMLSHGLTRISMGVQSWNPEILKVLGRVHTAEQAETSVGVLRQAGVKNLNLDLIFGTPGLALSAWREDLEKTITLEPEHVSAYCLTYEEDTEFFRLLQTGRMKRDVEQEAEFFEMTMDVLESAGYQQYEISNYAKPGFECHHNLGYWHGQEYLGLGPSAVSRVGKRRWQNVLSTEAYVAGMEIGHANLAWAEDLTEDVLEQEAWAFGLRTAQGVPKEAWKTCPEHLEGLTKEGYLEDTEEGRIRLTRPGRMVADEIASLLLDTPASAGAA